MRKTSPEYRLPLASRFWLRVEHRPGECWLWTGSRYRNGYGNVHFDGKNIGAHRLAWKLANGEIPAGAMVLHTCDEKLCCNPDHLYLGDHAANMRDMVERRRAVGRPRALTVAQAEEIRRRVAAGEVQARLAREYGVSTSVVWIVVNRPFY